MRVAAAGRPERSMGTAVIPAEPPRWAEVRAHAAELDPAATHLEMLLTLARAALALDGFPGLADALGSLSAQLDERWSALWPVADEDDPDEPWYARANLLADFTADDAFARASLATPLVDVRGIGTFSARDLDVADGLVDADDEERARCQGGLVDGAFAEAPLESLTSTRDALDAAIAACGRAAAALDREIGAGGGVPMAELGKHLDGVRARFVERAGTRLEADASASDGTGDAHPGVGDATAVADAHDVARLPSGASAPASSAAAAVPTLADHQAIRATLADVLGYYRRHEPGSPVAVLVARSLELVGSGFFELLGTLYPAGDGGGSLAERIAAPRPDPLATLLADGFDAHLAGTGDAVTRDEGGESGATFDTRDDVLRALDEVLAFYRVREPSSPVPVVLARARTLVPLDFDGVLDALGKVLATTTVPPVADG